MKAEEFSKNILLLDPQIRFAGLMAGFVNGKNSHS